MEVFGILDPDPHENVCGSETLICAQNILPTGDDQTFQLSGAKYNNQSFFAAAALISKNQK